MFLKKKQNSDSFLKRQLVKPNVAKKIRGKNIPIFQKNTIGVIFTIIENLNMSMFNAFLLDKLPLK